MSEIQDAHAIVEQMARLHAAHGSGDDETASALHRELVDRYGMTAIAEAMADRE